MKPFLITCLLLFTLHPSLFPQQVKYPGTDPSLPEWARVMYAGNPNVRAVEKAFENYYRTHDFEKSYHTQYYKRWRRTVDPFVDAQGFVEIPTVEEQLALQEAQREFLNSRGPTNATWECLGPFETVNLSNDGPQLPVSWQANVYGLARSLSNPELLYCGAEGGGVYKSTDKGLNWNPVTDPVIATGAVRAIAIHPFNPDTTYFGTNGVIYKTTDGGTTWAPSLTVNGLWVHELALHPTQPQIVLAATNKGYYRSDDAGLTWTYIYNVECWDLDFQPGAENVVYLLKTNAAAKRCEFFKSEDYGLTFQLKDAGWFNGTDPTRFDGGARLSVTPADPGRVYCILIGQSKAGDDGFIGVYRSNDAGETWTLPSGQVGGPFSAAHPNLMTINPIEAGYQQGFYDLAISVSHTNPDHLLTGGTSLWKSTTGGATFQQMGGYGGTLSWIHPDIQDIRTYGTETWLACDGGVNFSTDFFQSHEARNNGIVSSQFWGFDTGWNEDIVVGGRYHNGNSVHYETYPDGLFLRMGGAEAATGYVNFGENRRTYFSDIGGRIIPTSPDEPVISFSVGLWPNESYVEGECSEWEWHPHCWNIAWIGFENKLWKTENGGSSFELVHAFGTNPNDKLSDIEIAWSDPNTMYLVQRTANRKIWRTLDGGQTWTEVTPSGSVTGSNNWRNMALALDKLHPDTLWMMLTYGPNGNKIFRTIDGGLSWENWTTPMLNNFSPYSILPQCGTGGVYLGCKGGIFYRNNDMGDWELHGEGFPLSAEPNLLKPFYRDGKIRTATWNRSIWQADFYEPSPTYTQIGVDKVVSHCLRDTFYFNDHSILKHAAGVSWQWEFPGGNPAFSALRNPKVTYSMPGTYSVTLTITDSEGQQSTQILEDFLTVIDGCGADTIPGLALGLGGNGEPGYAVIPTLGADESNTFTISAWVKPDGPQPSYAGLVMRENASGINLRDNNELGFHWGGQHWWLSSGLTVTENNWSHVALVIEPGKATLYLNGEGVSFNATCDAVSLAPSTQIGKDRGWSSRHFKGEIDEICLWNRSLSQEEIRELRHLTKDPLADTTLLAYYQFNEPEGVVLDRARIYHAALSGAATRILSDVPAGKGVSKRLNVSAPGTYAFDNTGTTLGFGPTVPGGEVVLSRLVVPVDAVPDPLWPSTQGYWILNHYGANPFFDNPSMTLEEVGPISAFDAQNPGGILLYRRAENGFGPFWFSWDAASAAEEGSNGSVYFEDGTSIAGGAQWLLVNTNEQASAVPEANLNIAPSVLVFPNPLPAGQALIIRTGRLETSRIWLYDATGRRVGRFFFEGPEGIWQDINVPAGMYYYQVIGETFIWNGAVEVE